MGKRMIVLSDGTVHFVETIEEIKELRKSEDEYGLKYNKE